MSAEGGWKPDGFQLAQVKKIYMIAVCGTGMGSLAGLLKTDGYNVSGSDSNVYPPMSEQLAGQGIAIAQGYDEANVPEDVDLVIIGNAISKDNPEAKAVIRRGTPYFSFPQALGEIFISKKRSIVVSGTHGKTTTSALVAFILRDCGLDPSFLIGGVLHDFSSSMGIGGGEYFVVEGDEYDSAFFDKEPKFLHYRPEILIVGNLEFDHADIYKNLEEIETKFLALMKILPEYGKVIAGLESESVAQVVKTAPCPVESFGLDSGYDWSARNIVIGPETMELDVLLQGKLVTHLRSGLIGQHNARNIVAAMAACLTAGVTPEQFAESLERFRGVRRRQDVIGEANGILIIDDFAHHPTAVDVTLKSFRSRYPAKKIWAVFEPRTATSRRSIFQQSYKEAFDAVDNVVLAPLFAPEKIPEDQRMNIDDLIAGIEGRGINTFKPGDYDQILDFLMEKVSSDALVVFLSSGGFGDLPRRLRNKLSYR